MDRRTVLKGIAALSSLAGAVAVAKPGQSSLDGLLGEHAQVKEDLDQSLAAEDALYETPGHPMMARVNVSELPKAYHLFGGERDLMSYAAIGKLFDMHDDFHLGNGFIQGEQAARMRDKIEFDRKAAINLFAAREAEYERWRLSSGLASIEDRSSALSDREAALDDQILAWRCNTIEEVRGKARYIDCVYEDRMSQEALTAFVKGLLPALA